MLVTTVPYNLFHVSFSFLIIRVGNKLSQAWTRSDSFSTCFGLGSARLRLRLVEFAQSYVCVCYLGLLFGFVWVKLVLSSNKFALNLTLYLSRVGKDIVCKGFKWVVLCLWAQHGFSSGSDSDSFFVLLFSLYSNLCSLSQVRLNKAHFKFE